MRSTAASLQALVRLRSQGPNTRFNRRPNQVAAEVARSETLKLARHALASRTRLRYPRPLTVLEGLTSTAFLTLCINSDRLLKPPQLI